MNEWNTIKAFGNHLDSEITAQDIATKEKELGIKLSEPVYELYKSFNPKDPIFSFVYSLIPFDELELLKFEDSFRFYTAIPLFLGEGESYGVVVNLTNKNTGILEDYSMDLDPVAIGISTQSLLRKSRYSKKKIMKKNKVIISYDAFYSGHICACIMECLGITQLYSMPSIIAINSYKLRYGENSIILNHLKKCGPEKANVWVSKDDPSILSTTFSSDAFKQSFTFDFAFAAQTDEPLENFIKKMDFDFVWLKSQNGHKIWDGNKTQELSPERELFSITSVLEFLCRFAGTDGKCATDKEIANAEARIGAELPIPLKEYYRYLPKSCYEAYNTLRPLSKLKAMKDGKVNFLVENQVVFYLAAKPGSSFVYQKLVGEGEKWEPIGILDGYLVSEFFWALTSTAELNLVMEEFSGKLKPEMMEKGGKLFPFFSEIAGITNQISAGNFMELYQAFDGRVVALYEKVTPTLYLLAKDAEVLKEFIKVLTTSL